MIRVGYSTDVKTDAGFILTDAECELLIERYRSGWQVCGINSNEGRALLGAHVERIDREIASALIDAAETELATPNSKLLRKVEEAASFEEA